MALLCYNRGCGQNYEPDQNKDDSCLFHPGVPIFHDALKGWSCCRKRTTDFSEFLSIKGCTRGRHSNTRPQEPLRPEVSSDKGDAKHANSREIIYQGPKSAEKLQKERPSSHEPRTKLPQKVSASLLQVLDKLELSQRAELEQKENAVIAGTRCKNSGCKTAPRPLRRPISLDRFQCATKWTQQVYQGPETNMDVCTHHPGAPVFHEGYKYWSCCCIKTIDFNAFLDQKGCTTGKHRWVPKQDKKKVACRHDWHQTGRDVVVTIYAKNAKPDASSVEANQTVLSCEIQFENNKIFKREFHLWGVVDVKQSSVNMVPSKVEIKLRKADQVAWGKLEDPNHKPEPDPKEASVSEPTESYQPNWDIADDDISDSDEEWAYDTPDNRKPEDKDQQKKEEQILKTKQEVEVEMKNAMEEIKRAEEEKKRLEEERKMEEEGFEDMPELE